MSCSTRQVSWTDVRGRLESFPVPVLEALDSLVNRNNSKQFYVTSYSYGQLIVDNGQFKTPCDPDRCEACRGLLADASYSNVPLTGILDGSAEIFTDAFSAEEGQRVVPLKLLRRADIFGVFETLDYLLKAPTNRAPWSVSSGARSIWIIAPLGDARLPQYLSEVTDTDIDWTETDPHWKLVENATRNLHPWNSELLIFPHSVVKAVRRSTQIFSFLLELGWTQSSRLRDAATEDTELLKSANQVLRRMKVPQGELYHYRTIRHFQEMIRGVVPVFQSSNRVPPAGPFHAFADQLTKVARQTRSTVNPVVLQPGHLEREGDVGYYSFRCPSVPGPHLPPTTFAFSEIAEAYRDILQRLTRDRSSSFGLSSTKFFVRPVPQTRVPTGMVSVKDLPADDFYRMADPSMKSDGLYLNSPFLVAGMRICRSDAQQVASRNNIHNQARAAAKGS
jgi:hypothetical protein